MMFKVTHGIAIPQVVRDNMNVDVFVKSATIIAILKYSFTRITTVARHSISKWSVQGTLRRLLTP